MSLLGPSRCLLPFKPSRRGQLTTTHARKVRSKKQVAVSRTLVAKQGHENEVANLAGEILKWSQEECLAPGKGVIMVDCVRDGWEASTFHFWERYETTEAFGDHTTAPRMVELLTKLRPHLEHPIGMTLYSYEDGRLGPASMQAGPKGEGGLDDATGASGAAGGASYKQTSRAFDLTKVNEHEEAAREQQVLASMGGEPAAQGSADAGAAPQQGAQPDGGSASGSGKQEGAKAAKARIPLPPLPPLPALPKFGEILKAVNDMKSAVCRMLKHK